MIPYQILNKIRPYEVEVHGVRVKVTVVGNNDHLIDEKTCQLMKLIQKGLVGVDVKLRDKVPTMLLLCVEGHCLIFPNFFSWLLRLESSAKLGQLLCDQTICFVGSNDFGCIANTSNGLYGYNKYGNGLCKKIVATTVGIGRLAAMILKKPSLEKKSLQELAGEVGIDIKPVTKTSLDLDTDIFTEEEIKLIIHDVYASYLIGVRLLGIL